MLITFEGIEGSGKTTQIEACAKQLTESGFSVYKTKEPGGTNTGKLLRELILDTNTKFADDHTELLLFYADRLEHIKQIIKPNLDKGHIVLCDRFIDSTYAYQCGGRGISETIIAQLNTLITLQPNLTILYDCDPKIGLARAKKRAKLDRFEEEDLTFHQNVRHHFLSLASKYHNRIKTISINNKSIDNISRETWNHIKHYLK